MTDKMYILELQSGFHYESCSVAVGVSTRKEALEVERARLEAEHKVKLQRKQFYWDFCFASRNANPKPDTPLEAFGKANYPKWRGDQKITDEMRAERQRVIDEHEAYQAALRKPADDHRRIQGIVEAIFAHVNGISAEVINYDTDPCKWVIYEVPYFS